MGSKTGIEWTDSTWSPLRVRVRKDAAKIAKAKRYGSLVRIAGKMAGHVGPHCEHVSPGCANCYAEGNNHRCLPANGTGLPYDRRSRDLVEAFVDEDIVEQPCSWRKPRRIFVENQSDLFGEWVTDAMIDQVLAIIALCPRHTFQVLTKRPERMLKYLTRFDGRMPGPKETWARELSELVDDDGTARFGDEAECAIANAINGVLGAGHNVGWPMRNLWLGVSAENQQTADERIPLLLQTPAAIRFISAEPLLGPIDLGNWTGAMCAHENSYSESDTNATVCRECEESAFLDWVIVGCESGPGARAMDANWARSLRDQCQGAGIRFFFKQAKDNGRINHSPEINGKRYAEFPDA